ncbi:GRP family sugar transporter [Bifidobacterium sp. ESL0690]|uniref:GRP family sugar transporter n=1 Tax=Bifidobacterium sp. ESL0690 TaxID=2983214 RepID=UPI0023F63D62|nr:GRP family sugar transporter [Bifidobacterium sp. ESL0690]WEV46618.1 GRP family sugar transporter [Bifidobacterium sp. ESL0690]
MSILLALVPSILWGLYSLVIPKIGGSSEQQTLGVTLGALLFALVTFPFTPHNYNVTNVIVSLVSGFIWAFGCLYQVKSFKEMGVSRTIPITTGMQLIGTSLVGVLFLHELGTPAALGFGAVALVAFIIGITCTSYSEKTEASNSLGKGMLFVTISSVAIIIYVVLIELFKVNSFDVVLPQSIGMVLGALAVSIKSSEKRFCKKTAELMLPGILWAAGNLVMFYSNSSLGVAISFPLSQLGLVISTIGGVLFLKEAKTKKEKIAVGIGLIFVFLGVILIGFAKSVQ